MRSIVVYKIIILIGALILTAELKAQKPAIDLISSHQQYRHPAANIDTGYSVNPLMADSLLIQAETARNQEPKVEEKKKQHRQIGPSLDSLFRRKESDNRSRQKPLVKSSRSNRTFRPLYIFLNIIALK